MTTELLMKYGITALTFAFAGLGFLLGKFVYETIKSKRIRETLQRAVYEVESATLEVAQVYVDSLKQNSADGLTREEKDQAKSEAIAIAKQNIGKEGLARLARIFEVEPWLANKVEAFIGDSKPGKALGIVTPPKPAA